MSAWQVLLVALCLVAASGCALFKSPDPYDDVKSTRGVDPDDVANGTNPDDQKPLLDPSALSQDNVRRQWKQLIGQGPDRKIAREFYEKGRVAYEEASQLKGPDRSTKFVEAAEFFTAAADRLPDSALEQDAIFMSGECYFFADYYVEANRKYEILVKRYPHTRHMDTLEARRFLIARYWLKANDEKPYAFYQINITDQERPWTDTRGNAMRVFEKIRVDDPTGKLADDATLAAGMERFLKGEYEKADDYYTDLIKAYPESEHQFNAHFYGLKAKLNSYRGSSYAGDSLDEAEKVIKQMRRQFPTQSAQEREFLDKSYAEIRYKKAERNWRMAEYYDARTEYGGAKFYYGIVAREYDDTPFADRAANRMNELADKPDTPPQYFSWIVNLFPESDKLKPILNKSLIKPGEEPADAAVDVAVKE